ncbi:MAG: ABC transporter permease [Nitrospirota bacterium]|uniref:Phospholipid ABC transporter permease protein n=1 Tax=Candidatus Magnetominusculus xianensis TaxID=1748249 RepID=A0ABR5SII4_9BACT|nr:ABC transporter permease [Candidatus Magnetominusculus xianensis]KWT91022.1 putative phospholipid ABC transporter permease protein [Candidatus Magnetominusculus xianensis]MBF0402585.1 ABC transporter permease [Nitrospirota bacterium]
MPQIVENVLGAAGRKTLSLTKDLHKVAVLINEVFYWTIVSPLRGKPPRVRAAISEMVKTGYDSVLVVVVIAFFVGAILALQSAYQLKKFGAMLYVANLVGVAITRELGPIITAIIIAGRSGSAFAAEIGSMRAQEEVDALLSMGIHPVRFLVVPKLIALMLMQPALTTFFDVVGIFGGFALAVTLLDVNSASYINQTINALQVNDLVTGLVKAWAFSVVITITGAYQGFQVNAGAEEVGRRTTASVVTSIFMVIAFDLFFTALFYYFT